jgi:hypothetical protein
MSDLNLGLFNDFKIVHEVKHLNVKKDVFVILVSIPSVVTRRLLYPLREEHSIVR